jgi:hypothetical protein
MKYGSGIQTQRLNGDSLMHRVRTSPNSLANVDEMEVKKVVEYEQ